jgi:hypothetical protein
MAKNVPLLVSTQLVGTWFVRPVLSPAPLAPVLPDEGGPVILSLDAPDDVVRAAMNEWFPVSRAFSNSN